MRPLLLATLLMVGCGAGAKAAPDYAPLPDDPRLPKTATAGGASVSGGDIDPACIPAGEYDVAVDLSAASITQKNTGMDDTVWCKSMLEAVPAQMMVAMTIGYDDGKLVVEWPSGTAVPATVRGACSFEIQRPPVPATFTFVAGQGTATATYSIGTQNHPDESCTATGAAITVTPTGAP